MFVASYFDCDFLSFVVAVAAADDVGRGNPLDRRATVLQLLSRQELGDTRHSHPIPT
jgi:hypothetical protein